HFGGGTWGALSVALFKYDTGIVFSWNKHAGAILAWQLTGVLSIIAWTGTLSILLFGSLRLMRIFRVSEDVEKKGLDITRHGQHAYPAEAYGYSHLHIMTVGDQGKVSPIDQ
ncbi:ammonium transporter 1, partial [Biomphalaria glabrata]